jgi:hypothetical protein
MSLPMYLMYFWGFDPRAVTHVEVSTGTETLFAGPIEILEHAKCARGLEQAEPTFVFFSRSAFGEPLRGCVDCDDASLIIDTDEDPGRDGCPVHLVALVAQPLRSMCGMCARVF